MHGCSSNWGMKYSPALFPWRVAGANGRPVSAVCLEALALRLFQIFRFSTRRQGRDVHDREERRAAAMRSRQNPWHRPRTRAIRSTMHVIEYHLAVINEYVH